jgi:hypothetical protein
MTYKIIVSSLKILKYVLIFGESRLFCITQLIAYKIVTTSACDISQLNKTFHIPLHGLALSKTKCASIIVFLIRLIVSFSVVDGGILFKSLPLL